MLDILRQDVENTGGDFAKVYAVLEKGIESGKVRILRHGNTLLIYTIIDKGVAEVHISTIDPPLKIIEAFKSFYNAFKTANFRILMAETDNEQIVRMLQTTGIPIEVQQTEDEEGQPVYQITCEVK